MPSSCIVCRAKPKEFPERGFFSIPHDERRSQWIINLGLSEDVLFKDARVCSIHFSIEDYNVIYAEDVEDYRHPGSKKRRPVRLKQGAIPLLHGKASHIPENIQNAIPECEETNEITKIIIPTVYQLEGLEQSGLKANSQPSEKSQSTAIMEGSEHMELGGEDEPSIITSPKGENLPEEKAESKERSGITYQLQLNSLEDIESIIDAKLNEMNFLSLSDKAVDFLQAQLRTQERKSKDINKILGECEDQLKSFQVELEADKEVARPQIESGSDSDDDVQFIETTYEPRSHKQHRPVYINRSSVQTGASIHPGQDTETSPNANQNSQMVSILSQPPINSQAVHPGSRPVSQPAKPVTPYIVPTPKHIDLAIGMKLYGKKSNDIWYKGTLVDIQNKDRPRSERKYKIKFDGKGMKMLEGLHTACADPPSEVLPVGSRIIAMYKDEESIVTFYAGIIAELPSIRNNQRYLVFFDDGYAQYCQPKEIRRVCEQSKNVWEDIHPDSQSFIKSYLEQYPERPMVRLQPNQIIKTEWNGTWWTARVEEVDASLVKMFFEADKRVEKIYRGSTRLEPLYTELANAEATKASGKGRRHNVNVKSAKKPYVEYTQIRHDDTTHLHQQGQRYIMQSPATSQPAVVTQATVVQPNVVSTDYVKKRSVARKSTAVKGDTQKPWQSMEKRSQYQASSISRNLTGRDMASVLHSRLNTEDMDEESLGERMEIDRNIPKDVERKRFRVHACNQRCIKDKDDNVAKYKGNNPLLIPMLYGWERQIGKQKNTGRRIVFYRAPCSRRLRSIEEVDKWLRLTNSMLTIDLFCFDVNLHTHSEFVPIKTFCDIKDLSYGKENVPISCVNGIDRQYPDYVEYSNVRIPAKGVHLNLDKNFLCGCDCTDGCRDPNKCSCIQLTQEATKAVPGTRIDNDYGYSYRRLNEQLFTGIYECNAQCSCDSRCLNRVAQNGLQLRLQVFKTEKRGWGIRCLDDIPEGGFICVYAGQLLTEQGANEDGQQYGDEYLAELDYIEVVESKKEGYESDVDINIDEGIGEDEEGDSDFNGGSGSDSTYSGEKRFLSRSKNRSRSWKVEKEENKERAPKLVLKRKSSTNKEEAWSVKADQPKHDVSRSVKVKDAEMQQKTADWVKSIPNSGDSIIILDSDDEEDNPLAEKKGSLSLDESKSKYSGNQEDTVKSDETETGLLITEPTSLNTENLDSDEEDKEDLVRFKRTTRASTKVNRMGPDPKSDKDNNKEKDKEEKKEFVSTRTYLHDEFCYVMDAKSMGNLGRYLNHSCNPNVFVQNVFVDTHDLRFPWVAFFAARYIRAGTELTWDYNYEVGSVPGKVLYCYCGAAECRGRLL